MRLAHSPRFRPLDLTPAGLVSLLALVAAPAHAAWPINGKAISAWQGSTQNAPILVATTNGALVVWEDFRNDSDEADLYGRFVDTTGTLLGAEILIAVIVNSSQRTVTGVSDGAGGALLAWQDNRDLTIETDIYSQRIAANGALQWGANGLAISRAAPPESDPVMVSDGLISTIGVLPGAWVSWQDYRFGDADIKVRHVGTNGPDGSAVQIVNKANDQEGIVMTGDGVSSPNVPAGCVIGWINVGAAGACSLVAQRVNSSSALQWTADGVTFCAAPGVRTQIKAARFGQNYVFVWKDSRGARPRIYAQELNVNGVAQWTADGFEIAPFATGDQGDPAVIQSDAGSFIVTWSDTRNGNADIYAQRIDVSGVVTWTAGGIPLCTAPGDQTGPAMTNNPGGNAFVTWTDMRHGSTKDIYAQRIGPNAAISWVTDGIPICNASTDQTLSHLVTNGSGAIVTWTDVRNESLGDVYAMRLTPSMVVGVPLITNRTFQLALRSPNPSRGDVRLDFSLAEASSVAIEVFDLSGRRIGTLLSPGWREAGHHTANWDGRDESGAPAPAGLYLVRARAGGQIATLKVARLN